MQESQKKFFFFVVLWFLDQLKHTSVDRQCRIEI